MSRSDQLAWAITRFQFSGESSTQLQDGSSLSLQPVSAVVSCPEQFRRVKRKHGVNLDDLVPVETTITGDTRNHWTQTVQS